MKEYRIILMDYEGNVIYEYYSYIIPTLNDTIMIDDEKQFIVEKRHFTTNSLKVVLLGSIEEDEEQIKK